MRCALALADGTEIVCHLDHAEAAAALGDGRDYWVSWDVEAGRLLPPRPPAAAKGAAHEANGAAAHH